MKQELRPLTIAATAVLTAGLVAGVAFASLSDSAVLVGMAFLALLMIVLFMVARRDDSHHSDEPGHHRITDIR